MSERDYVLAVLDAAGRVPGRTMLQKLVYLLGRTGGRDLGYAPHFYGPYSAEVQRITNDLRDLGLIDEGVEVLSPWAPDQFDVHQFRYALTDSGRQEAATLDASLRADAARVVGAAKSANAWGQSPLAAAAKLDHLRQIEPGLDFGDVPTLAASFGWRLTPGHARQAARLLEELGLW
jgi:hypothetical protein